MAEVNPDLITASEASAIARMIEPDLRAFASRYDVEKYSPAVYAELREAFRVPDRVRRSHIERALRWKFGHRDKLRIPEAHSRLIADLGDLWPEFVRSGHNDPGEVCRYLLARLDRPHAFITVAFLAHLLYGNRVPIVDQHNLRAVNHFMRQVRPSWRGKRKPEGMRDVSLVREFLEAVTEAWPEDEASCPSRTELDRFLMMYGKALKAGRGVV